MFPVHNVLIFAFGHQGGSNCQKMEKTKKNQNNIFPVHIRAAMGDWLFPSIGVLHKLCKLGRTF